MMPDITQRIADILDNHTPSGATGLVNCWCGIADFHTFGEHAGHVAEVLTTELGLSRQTSRFQPYGHNGLGSRYVTDWVVE